ncbi:MAG: RluA family pseudouridine synthase [Verrucomicrobia bacterium]|nr:RluA family pseudouridine synthase [Verrucomicrobiota bacterium]
MKHIAERSATLLEILHEMAPESSKNTLRSWLQSGRVTVDHQRAERANIEVLPGQEVLVGPKVTFLKGSLRILHDDDQIVVLEKPEGLLSVATEKETRATVHAMLKRQFHNRRVYPVHRLDRETSGVMLFVYNEKARDDLKSQFEQQTVDKTYFAIVEKEMPLGKGTWESYMEEDDFFFVKSTNDSTTGKRAVTHYEVLKAERNRSLLRLKPQTGRKNQLRVHCSEAGHPIIGDKKYGSHSNPLKRLCLHAQKITFTHPLTRRRMTFSAQLPEVFSKILDFKDLAI